MNTLTHTHYKDTPCEQTHSSRIHQALCIHRHTQTDTHGREKAAAHIRLSPGTCQDCDDRLGVLRGWGWMWGGVGAVLG